MYHCAACSKPVTVVTVGDRQITVRSCNHEDAAIVAEMKARAEGHGGVR